MINKTAVPVLFLLLGPLGAGCTNVLVFDDPCASAAGVGSLVMVVTAPSRLSFFPSIQMGDTLTLSAAVRPIAGAHTNVSFGGCDFSYGDSVPAIISWSSTDTAVARVSQDGLVTARAMGNADIIARDAARNLKAAYGILVNR